MRRHYYRRRGFSRLDLIFLILIGLVFTCFFFFYRGPTRQGLSRKTVCSANLKGIGTGLFTYANENNDFMPVAPHMPATDDAFGQVNYVNKIGFHRGKLQDDQAGATTDQDTEMSNTRNLWMLIRMAASTPEAFVCPVSTQDAPNDEDYAAAFWDFRKYTENSYGYQIPYGRLGRPSIVRHQKMPLAADKGPVGYFLEQNQTIPPNSAVLNKVKLSDPDALWRPYNSPNHNYEGQNVLYADSHVNFETLPTVGIENDNIYTRWSQADGGGSNDPTPRIIGTLPNSNETPWSNTDSLIYP